MPVPYRKLVRDRIPEIIAAEGRHPVTRVLDEAGYRQALLDKLVEEAGEAARASAADLPGELADVLEVLRALTAAAGMSWEQLLVMVVAAASKRSADCASGRACQPWCEREGGDEGLANPRIAVAGFERGLLGIRIIPCREVTALAAGQAHRPVPVPGLVAREGDVDPRLLAGEDNYQVAVDIGQPALRDCASRLTARRCAPSCPAQAARRRPRWPGTPKSWPKRRATVRPRRDSCSSNL